VLPHQRQEILTRRRLELKAETMKKPVHDEQQLQKFQILAERSLREGLPTRITSVSEKEKTVTTGIVIKADLQKNQLVIKTLEGIRVIPVQEIVEMLE